MGRRRSVIGAAGLIVALPFAGLACSGHKSAVPTHFVCNVHSVDQRDRLSVDVGADGTEAQTLFSVPMLRNGRTETLAYLVKLFVEGPAGARQARIEASMPSDRESGSRSVRGPFPFSGSVKLPAQYAMWPAVVFDCPTPT